MKLACEHDEAGARAATSWCVIEFYLSCDRILFARQPTNGLLDVSAEAVGQAHDLDLFRLLGRVRQVFLARDLRGVNGRPARLDAAGGDAEIH